MKQRCAFCLLSLILLVTVFLHAGPARADCQLMLECCLQVVDAHEERGLSGRRLTEAVQTCHVYESLSSIPGAQAVFCINSWYLISQSAWEDFQAGRIGFYPESCYDDPTLDPDEVIGPPPDELDPDPQDAGE